MRRWLLVGVALLGCRITGTIGRDDPNGGGSGGGTESPAVETDAGGTDTDVVDTAEGGGSGGSAEDSTGGMASGSGGTTASTPHACIPTPDDTACAACRKTSCCEPLEACLAHETCTCVWDCVLVEGHTVDACATHCETDGALYGELQTCTHNHCDACP